MTQAVGDVQRAAPHHLVLSARGQRVMDRGWPAVKTAFARLAPHLERDAADYVERLRELRAALRVALAESDAPSGTPSAQS